MDIEIIYTYIHTVHALNMIWYPPAITSSSQAGPELQQVRQRSEGAEVAQSHVEALAVVRRQPRQQP